MAKMAKKVKKAKKVNSKSLRTKLFFDKESAWLKVAKPEREKALKFSEGYKRFMSVAKTERECVAEIIKTIKPKGYIDLTKAKSVKPGDKIYFSYKDKVIIFGVLGKSLLNTKVVGSHIDSPRLDLKPFPLFEDSGVALLRTHYYGGIKKYQWVNQPLAIHGVVVTGKKTISLDIGEKETDPVFIIPDLLPHLAKSQMEKDGRKIVVGEQLTVLAGSIPFDEKDAQERIKLNVLRELNNLYGITEQDLVFAEIEIVPAMKARDAGFDRSMVAAYGQDDRLSAYTSMVALLDSRSKDTRFVACFDKEETGSDGNTGAKSRLMENFFNELLRKMGNKREETWEIMKTLQIASADVQDAVTPQFKEVHELTNSHYIGSGVILSKYGGAGGKYYTNDCNAEFINALQMKFDKNKVIWQAGEGGRIDEGGGGTIAMYFAKYGCEVVELGAPTLATHSPYEVASKMDIYQAYRSYKIFFE